MDINKLYSEKYAFLLELFDNKQTKILLKRTTSQTRIVIATINTQLDILQMNYQLIHKYFSDLS